MPKHPEDHLEREQLSTCCSQSQYAFLADKAKPKFQTLHFIMAHSKEHTEWSLRVETQLKNLLFDLVPFLIVSVDQVLVTGTQADVRATLSDYYAVYASRAAEKTLIITPGWFESQMVALANSQAVLPYKQLFCLPSGQPGKFLQKTLTARAEDGILGGVYNMEMPAHRYIHSIRGFRPDAKKVCIAYDPATSSDLLRQALEAQVAELKTHCARESLEVVLHHWTPQDMHTEALRAAAHDADSVVILNEPAAAVHKKTLIRFCNAWNVFVCSSELDSVMEGAALGCGISGAAFAAPLTALIMEHFFYPQSLESKMGWSLHRIPEQSGMRFNEWAFAIQGVDLSKDREELIRMKSVFDVSVIEY